MTRPSARRVLVATDRRHCPEAAIEHARWLAGKGGEVVLACVLVVPVSQPLDAALDRAVEEACGVLERGEHAGGVTDTRLLRSRSFSRGVLDLLDAETFDVLVLERAADTPGNGSGRQQQEEVLMERAPAAVAIVRPARARG